MVLLGWCIAVALLAIAALHFFWAWGGRWGGVAAIPQRDGAPLFTPGRTVTLFMSLLFLLAACILLIRSGAVPWPFSSTPPRLVQWGSWTIAVLFLLRAAGDFRVVGFFKRVRNGRFALLDDRLYSPLALVIAIGSAFIAKG